MDDYRVKGVGPDMSKAAFIAALQQHGSPVSATEAGMVYAYCVGRRVSVAWLLAVFNHESSMGKAGTATETHSWGNTRAPSFGVPDLGQVAGRSGTFSRYADWADGGVATVARVCDHTPYANANTVREITPIWAPPGDGNNTERYIAAVLADIGRFAQPQEASMAPGPPIDKSHPSPNRGYNNGYQHQPQAVVWHITEGTNSLGWLTNPASKASSNYLIARDGTIYELVPPTESAWANGAVCKPDTANPLIQSWQATPGLNFNQRTISVEHEGFTSKGQGGSLTLQQVAATVALTAWLCRTFGIAPDQTHILGHYEIDNCTRPNCPGFSAQEWERWVQAVAVGVAIAPDPPAPIAGVTTPAIDWEGAGTIVASEESVIVRNETGAVYQRRRIDGTLGPWVQLTEE